MDLLPRSPRTRSPRISSFSAAAFAALLVPVSAAATPMVAPAGTKLELRLESAVSSASSKPGDPVEAVVVAPVEIGGRLAIPAGAAVLGKVSKAEPAPGPGERAILGLDFNVLRAGAGELLLKGLVTSVDNARERVDADGRILGIVAAETISARMDAGIEMLATRNAALAEVLGAVKGAVLRPADAEIAYEPGVELFFTLTRPLAVRPPEGAGPRLDPMPDPSGLARLVARQPLVTMAEKPRAPSDLVNLMFIGGEDALRKAFREAGWTTAADLTPESVFETFRAIAELRGYKEAPVSLLTLNGKPPDVVFQKKLNTFDMRHHIRVWRRPEKFQGQPVWVGAATHDTGIAFSAANRSFFHTIDPHIDRERAKVVNDLLFTGMVRSHALVGRPDAPKRSRNATGDEMITDGAIAVLLFRHAEDSIPLPRRQL